MNYYVLEVEKNNFVHNADGSKELKTTETYFFAMKEGQKFPVGGPFQTSEEAEQHIVAIEEKRINEKMISENDLSDIEADQEEADETLLVGKVDGNKITEELSTFSEVFDSAEKAMAGKPKAQPEDQEDKKNEVKSAPTREIKPRFKK